MLQNRIALGPVVAAGVLFVLLGGITIVGAGPITVDYNVRIPMRDGSTLSADIYRPAGPGPYPVVLMRTPYLDLVTGSQEDGRFWAAHGYVYAIQVVRG